MRSRRSRCACIPLLSASKTGCAPFLSASVAGVLRVFGRTDGARGRAKGRATESSRSAVRTCPNLDSDGGFELPGHDLLPSG